MTEADDRSSSNRLSSLWRWSGALRGAIAAGGIAGFVVGGVGGRAAMRLVAIMDPSTDGVRSSGGTVGEITLGGTFGLFQFTTAAGVAFAIVYILLRRWLPGSGPRRWLLFGAGVVMIPGWFFVATEIDFQIFQPVIVIIVLFQLIFFAYGVTAARLLDAFHPARRASGGLSRVMLVHRILAAVAVLFVVLDVLTMVTAVSDAGSCLTANGGGGCAIREDEARTP